MNPQLEDPWSQDLSSYDQATQERITQLIAEDESVRAQYFDKGNDEQPAQVIGASGFSGGLNMAISPATGPI